MRPVFYKLSFLVYLVVTLAACQRQVLAPQVNNNANIPIGDTSRNALDWKGIYEGVLPCADCEGILTRIELRSDETFTLTTTYLGKSDADFSHEGKFEWNDQGSTITIQGVENRPTQYLVGENQLFQLDLSGNRITGDLASQYILRKAVQQDSGFLIGKRWLLVAVMGQEVSEELGIFITFEEESNRFNGFGGCNQYFGTYELNEGWRIQLSRIGRTQKHCQEVQEIEDRFFEALETVDNYSINEEGNVLTLNKARMAPLLRFEIDS